jgi:hypothetical protein
MSPEPRHDAVDPMAARARIARMLKRHLAMRSVYLQTEDDYLDIAAQIASVLPIIGKLHCGCMAPVPQVNGRYEVGKYQICRNCNRGFYVSPEYVVTEVINCDDF